MLFFLLFFAKKSMQNEFLREEKEKFSFVRSFVVVACFFGKK